MSDLIAKAKLIKLLILDVDGVLTSGAIYYDSETIETKGFHVQDGLGIKLLQKTGVHIAILSGRKSAAVQARAKELAIKHVYLGHENKLTAYEALKQKLNLTDKQIAHMGDDLPDLPLFIRVGLAISVPQAPEIIREKVDLVTRKKAGKGAVREACEFIMKAQNQYQSLLQFYLT